MHSDMNQKSDGGPAFPGQIPTGNDPRSGNYVEGMTLRDYFAAKALTGITSNDACMKEAMQMSVTGNMDRPVRDAVADIAYRYADAMLAARKAGAE